MVTEPMHMHESMGLALIAVIYAIVWRAVALLAIHSFSKSRSA
jgi:hypothetical protein